jgi:hypothetical protein
MFDYDFNNPSLVNCQVSKEDGLFYAVLRLGTKEVGKSKGYKFFKKAMTVGMDMVEKLNIERDV